MQLKRKRRIEYCKNCGKELVQRVKRYGKIFSYFSQSKSMLCRSCSSKEIYEKRGAFTHSHGRLFTKDEISILKEKYRDSEREELCKLLNRNWSSIMHKAIRIGLKRNPKFKLRAGGDYFKNHNPMSNPTLKKKIREIIRRGWIEGKYKVGGIAKRSMLGLTKKENHPNWKGGISFEPYDSKFDEEFCKQIRSREKNVCFICNKVDLHQRLSVHHIDYDKKHTTSDNCVALCNSCHCKTHYNRLNWILFFQKELSEQYDCNYSSQLPLIKSLWHKQCKPLQLSQ